MTEKLKATPGPWKVESSTDGFISRHFVYRTDGSRSQVARVMATGKTGEANAHLIAAAPLLYEALERLAGSALHEDHSEYGRGPDSECDACRAVAALKAARGET